LHRDSARLIWSLKLWAQTGDTKIRANGQQGSGDRSGGFHADHGSFNVIYNPDLRLWFVLPPSLNAHANICRRAGSFSGRPRTEVGTIEQILATPTRPLELLLGKMIPLLVLCYFIMGLILVPRSRRCNVQRHQDCISARLLLHHVEFGIVPDLHCVKIKDKPANEHSGDVIQHSDGDRLSAQRCLIPQWIRVPPLTYFIHISRIIMKGGRDIPVVRCDRARDLQPDRHDRSGNEFQEATGLVFR
jgi:hypothetical protein